MCNEGKVKCSYQTRCDDAIRAAQGIRNGHTIVHDVEKRELQSTVTSPGRFHGIVDVEMCEGEELNAIYRLHVMLS